jgi:pyrimidine operon attenuation protein/uracil phosphoribosyltransferase
VEENSTFARGIMTPRLLLSPEQFHITINRLCHQLIEVHDDFSESCIIGLQPRGIFLAQRITDTLKKILGRDNIPMGELDATFHRDDFRRRDLVPARTSIDFVIEDKNVILIDDVLWTGRMIRAGLDAMMTFGRPKDVELLVLIDRRFSRNLPIQAKYVGRTIDTIASEKVTVEWKEKDGEDKVWLLTQEGT